MPEYSKAYKHRVKVLGPALINAYNVRSKDGLRWGILEYFQEKARKGLVAVEDAEMPVYRLERPDDLVPVEFEEYDKHLDKLMNAAIKRSDKLHGCVPGKLFRIGVGDGHAWYVVTKVGARSVVVEWRAYSPDRYVDRMLGMGGSYPKKMIEPFVNYEDGMRKLFAKPRIKIN